MPEVPRHPDTLDEGSSAEGTTPATRRWRMYALVILAVALLVLIIVLHLAGIVGPGSHGL